MRTPCWASKYSAHLSCERVPFSLCHYFAGIVVLTHVWPCHEQMRSRAAISSRPPSCCGPPASSLPACSSCSLADPAPKAARHADTLKYALVSQHDGKSDHCDSFQMLYVQLQGYAPALGAELALDLLRCCSTRPELHIWRGASCLRCKLAPHSICDRDGRANMLIPVFDESMQWNRKLPAGSLLRIKQVQGAHAAQTRTSETKLSLTRVVHCSMASAGLQEVRQLGSLAGAAANAADVSGRPVAAVQLQQASTICLGIAAEGDGFAGGVRLPNVKACSHVCLQLSVS